MVQRIPKDDLGFIPRSGPRGTEDNTRGSQQVESAGEPETRESEAPKSNSDHLLTVDEVAERLKAPPSWVYSHADEIGVLRMGKYLRFEWKTVLERLREGVPAHSGDQPPLASRN
jgi:hypothetical protein